MRPRQMRTTPSALAAGRIPRYTSALRAPRCTTVKTRRFRLLIVLASLVALLLSDVALAGYACPGSEKAVAIASMVEAEMPCAEEMSRAMDEAQPGLCHAHCQGSQQSADSPQPPVFAAAMDLGVVLTVDIAEFAPSASQGVKVPPGLRRLHGPPLAIRHCCFRI